MAKRRKQTQDSVDAKNKSANQAPEMERDSSTATGGGDAEELGAPPEAKVGDPRLPVPPTPPDGGYGWVVMVASFFINVLVDGVCFSFGIFFLEFLAYYRESKEQTSWVGSVLNGMYLSMGPLVSALANKFGCRRVTIAGSIIASASLVLSTLSPNVQVLILLYGGLTGFGFGLMYLPAIVMVGFYFEKKRAFATGVAVCGSGIGAFVFAPMCEYLLNVYDWKGTTLILAGLVLNGAVMGALFRPIETPRKRKSDAEAQEYHSSGKSCSGERTPAANGGACERREGNTLSPAPGQGKKSLLTKLLDDENGKSTTQSMHNLFPDCTADNASCRQACLSKSCDNIFDEESKEQPVNRTVAYLKNPLSRKDIFYSGSIHNLPEYKQVSDRDSYVRSITSVPDEAPPKENSSCGNCLAQCKSFFGSIRTMMDFSLLKNPVFCIYGASCFLCMTGFFVPFTYLPDHAIGAGLDRKQAAFLLSIIGIANTVARVAAGWVSDQPWADCLLINNCALVVGGVATMLCPFCLSYPLLSTYSFVFGASIAVFVSLRSIIMVELMGLERLTNAFGLVTMCQGFSSFIGAPIAGALYDATGTYHMSFYVAGATLAMAGVICFPLRRVAKYYDQRQYTRQRALMLTASPSDDSAHPALDYVENGTAPQL